MMFLVVSVLASAYVLLAALSFVARATMYIGEPPADSDAQAYRELARDLALSLIFPLRVVLRGMRRLVRP